mmetsp:Transcript_2285/g.9116  ORF Transcript_2285/g.9116 Transcript_2285/m.9116 type:complete len:286 (+) Transcript_2285:229-1086(+)
MPCVIGAFTKFTLRPLYRPLMPSLASVSRKVPAMVSATNPARLAVCMRLRHTSRGYETTCPITALVPPSTACSNGVSFTLAGSHPSIAPLYRARRSLKVLKHIQVVPEYGTIPMSEGVSPAYSPLMPLVRHTPRSVFHMLVVASQPRGATAMRARTMSSGYVIKVDVMPATAPATNFIWRLKSSPSSLRSPATKSCAAKLIAAYGTTRASTGVLPFHSPRTPSRAIMSRVVRAAATYEKRSGETCMMIFMRSTGASRHFASAPASAPDVRCRTASRAVLNLLTGT